MTTAVHQFGQQTFQIPWTDYISYDKETKTLGWKSKEAKQQLTMAEIYQYMKQLTRQEDEHTLQN